MIVANTSRRHVGPLLLACLALACLLTTAGCTSRSSGTDSPSSAPARTRPALGIGACKDDAPAEAPPSPATASPPPVLQQPIDQCEAELAPDETMLELVAIEPAALGR